MRLEDHRLLTAGGSYLDDLPLPGAAHVVFVRSAHAHARVTDVDAAAAAAMPGVLAVRRAAEVDLAPHAPDPPMLNQAMAQPILTEVARFAGEPVAVVVAETRAQAGRAAAAVRVNYEPLPVVTDPARAAGDEVLLHAEAGTNVAFKLAFARPAGRGDTFDGCEVVVAQEMDNPRLAPCPLEVRAGAARWEGGRLTYWGSTQGVHLWRAALAKSLGVDAAEVRVLSPDVGGAFGAKGLPYPEDVLVAWLARALDRPLRWAETRTESMVGLGHGRAQRQLVEIGGTRDGRILGYRLTVLQDCGAYPRIGAFLPYATRTMLTGVYRIERAKFTASSVVTNTTPVVAYRGAGQPEATGALERAVDLFAAEIGMDPAEVRRRNLIPPDAFPHRTLTRVTYDAGDYPAALERVLQAAGYERLREEQRARRAGGGVRQLGVGLSVFVKVSNADTRPEHARVEVRADGTAEVTCGTFAHGQGHVTAYAALAGQRLGIARELVEVRQGDSDELAEGGGTGGSRSLQTGGVAVSRAAQAVLDRARELAAKELGVESVEFDGGFGGLTWSDVVAVNGAPISAEVSYQASAATFPYGAYLAVVEVDTETGRVWLRRMVTVDDAGRILDPVLAEGQVHGGVAQGVAQALFEHMRYDEQGRPLTGTLADYLCVSPAELPSLETILMETPTPVNELGAKGIAESGAVGAPAAVQNAVVDALAHLGVRHVDLPATPERVWRAIAQAGRTVSGTDA
ncbi:MAG: carbon monoxide dehydrogenase large subunit [Nonomuraea muscovyensis]|nr:carbon monoxide dehydrogenase large subunit [Nonomuraea muscovyensis]